ncbi:MAG TPA: hypothetical protein PLE74_04845 [Candidatus Cloacimonadota bacterium]|nr:hypothetical protein [Candidatus Cloacimonadota bacterium]HPT71588.1 hypothetical protein [Candidatus Cloacimonadota bacterium]
MKKNVLTLLLLIFAITSIFANAQSFYHNPRVYYQKLFSPAADIMKIVTNKGRTHNENYLVEVTCSSSPGQVLTTAQPGGESPNCLRLFSINSEKNHMVLLFLQLAEFNNQVAQGDEIHCKVIYIGKGKYQDQSTSWSYFVPEGSKSILVTTPGEEQIVPPLDKKTLEKIKK